MSVAGYQRFLSALNDQDLSGAAEVVDLERYQENCVGFTPGFVGWEQATGSLSKVWEGIPDLYVDIVDIFGDESTVLARGTARGTNSGASTAYRRPGGRTGSPSSTRVSSRTARSCVGCSRPM